MNALRWLRPNCFDPLRRHAGSVSGIFDGTRQPLSLQNLLFVLPGLFADLDDLVCQLNAPFRPALPSKSRFALLAMPVPSSG
jgi:hypothetical protein